MSRKESLAPLSDSVLAEATAWFIDCNEGELDNSGRERLHQWLRRSPEHVRAYLEIAAAWQDANKLRGREAVDHAALISTALAETNVVALSAAGRSSGPANRASKPASPRFRELLYASAAALLVVAIGLVSMRWIGHNIYSTDVGEQRSIVLADGSTVELNARSELRVHFSSAERTVDLLEGQALFHARKDAARPFVVVSNGTRVRAVGTQFDVYRKRTGTVVTVIEGRVAVTASHLQVLDTSLDHAWDGPVNWK